MDNPEKLATYGTQDEGAIKHGQSRETGNIGYTRRRGNQTWTMQRNWCLIGPSSCVPYVASVSGLSVFDCPFVLCTICCQFLCIVHVWLPLRLVYPMLPVSLDCPCLIAPSSCVPYVTSFSGLSMFDCPFVLCTLCCQFLWIVHVWLPLRLVYSLLPVSLDCPCLIAPSSCVPSVDSFSGLSMFDFPFVFYTRRRGNQTWTIQRNWQHRVHKTKGQSNMENREKLAT
jgi:hypothetical protein